MRKEGEGARCRYLVSIVSVASERSSYLFLLRFLLYSSVIVFT